MAPKQKKFNEIINLKPEKESFKTDWDRQRITAKEISSRFQKGFDTILLADEVGMGKTYVALSVIADHIFQSDKNDRKVILITPPSAVLREKWEQDIRNFDEKYIAIKSPRKRLRPIRIDGYWDLVQNLHDYDNDNDLTRIHDWKRNCFLYCFFLWGKHREKVRNVWEVLKDFDRESPEFLGFRSQYSLQAMFSYFDETNAKQNKGLFNLITKLYKGELPDREIKDLFKEFAAGQDHYEANIFLMGMNSLKRPRSDKYDNQLFCSFVLGALLKGRREKTREDILKAMEPTGMILRRNHYEHFEKYRERVLTLSTCNYFGLKDTVDTCISENQEFNRRWGAILAIATTSDSEQFAKTLSEFFKDASDLIFQMKLGAAGVGLAVIDEVHNWKNEKLGAKDFKKNYSPHITHKLIMSATPFQIEEGEMQKLFNLVQMQGGLSSQILQKIYEEGLLVKKCLNASKTFRHEWENLSDSTEDVTLLNEELSGIASDLISELICKMEQNPATSTVLQEFLKAMHDYRHSIEALSAELRNIIIRHTKNRDKRHFHIGADFSQVGHLGNQRKTLYAAPGYTNPADAFVNFIAIRLDQLIRRDMGKDFEANARLMGGITSSTSAFLESAKRLDQSIIKTQQTRDYRRLFEKILEHHEHPKVAATVEHAFTNYTQGRKTLIFCERVATLKDIKERFDEKIGRSLEQPSREGLKKETLLKSYRSFVDNFWWLSLLETLGSKDKERWLKSTKVKQKHAIEFVENQLKSNNKNPTVRRVIRLLDAYYFQDAFTNEVPKEFKTFEQAVTLAHWSSTPELISSFLSEGEIRSKDRIEEFSEDITADITLIADHYIQSSNLWFGNGSRILHDYLWRLLNSEAEQLLGEEPGRGREHLSDNASGFSEIMIELMEGIRKVALRQDLLSRYERDGKGDSSIDRIKDGFCNIIIGSEPTRAKIIRYLRILLESSGTINQASNQSSKRRSLWKGVFLKEVGYVETLDGNVDPNRRVNLCAAFNSPLAPDVLICTAIGSEGIDLHRNCAEVIHHDLPWNPAKLEQRNGRVDRVDSLAENTEGLLIQFGIPFLAHNYEKYQYDVVHSRAQKFEVLMGRPEYSMEHLEEELFKEEGEAKVQDYEEDIGQLQVLAPLPEVILDYLKVDLSLERSYL